MHTVNIEHNKSRNIIIWRQNAEAMRKYTVLVGQQLDQRFELGGRVLMFSSVTCMVFDPKKVLSALSL